MKPKKHYIYIQNNKILKTNKTKININNENKHTCFK